MDRTRPGFPVGSDEAIAALSDPPHYTACPNPGAAAFAAASGARRRYVARAPLAADVSEGRGDPIYNAHGYHTKIPPRAIVRWLVHHTRPGELVYDGFCGSGMTGVAAQLCAAPDEELRAAVERERCDAGLGAAEWGARRAFLSDLSPAATFIADSFNRALTELEPRALLDECAAIARDVEAELGWMFEVADGGRIVHALWSDVFACPACAGEIVYFHAAVDRERGLVRDRFACPSCGARASKRELERAWDFVDDRALGRRVKLARAVPIELTCERDGRRYRKAPDDRDRARLERARAFQPAWHPTSEILDGDKSGDAFSAGIYHVHHMYTPRNLAAIAALWARCRSRGLGFLVTGILQRASKQHQVAVSRVGGPRARDGGKTAGHRRGTLYVPSNQVEFNPLELFRERARVVAKACGRGGRRGSVMIETCSAARSSLPDASVDYVFVDPPFGGNIQYSELNIIFESWLGVRTRDSDEAVINQTRKRALVDYQNLMTECFKDFHRVLKPGRPMTLVFHSSSNAVWDALHESLLAAGFSLADVRTLDKVTQTHTQRTAARAVQQDLVLTAVRRAPRRPLVRATCDDAWRFITRRLRRLPKATNERRAFLLYDRMVAFHLKRGRRVPMDASSFYAGLDARYRRRGDRWYTK
jgi:hypothetical protein